MGYLVSRKYSRICGLWDTWFQGSIPGYVVYGTPGFKEVFQDMWFMGHLVSRHTRILGLWETWFQSSIPGYVVYGTTGFKVVYQDMWFMGQLVSRFSMQKKLFAFLKFHSLVIKQIFLVNFFMKCLKV